MNNPEIIYTNKDIFHIEADVLFNPVNTKGVMGKGLASQFKKRYPSHFVKYRDMCYSKRLRVGQPEMVYDKGEKQFIMLFPTKTHWRSNSKLKYISKGLEYIAENFCLGHSIAIPMLGCGLGGLDWDDVKSLLEEHCLKMDVSKVYICEWDKEYNSNKVV